MLELKTTRHGAQGAWRTWLMIKRGANRGHGGRVASIAELLFGGQMYNAKGWWIKDVIL